MNQNETRTLWISVAAAIFAVFLLYSYTQEKSAELTKKFGAKKRVVVAKTEIREMQTIDETMLQVQERPVDFSEPGSLTDPEIAVGQVALAPINVGEQVLESKIRQPGPGINPSSQVAPTKRGMALPIDANRGVAKLLKPGDRIDILVAVTVGSGPKKTKKVKTILQNITILATGMKIINELPRLFEKDGKGYIVNNLREDTDYSTILVEVSPQEAEQLVYILDASPSSIYYTLRHPSDQEIRKKNGPTSIGNIIKKVKVKKPRVQYVAPRIPAATLIKSKPKKRRKRKSGPFKDID